MKQPHGTKFADYSCLELSEKSISIHLFLNNPKNKAKIKENQIKQLLSIDPIFAPIYT